MRLVVCIVLRSTEPILSDGARYWETTFCRVIETGRVLQEYIDISLLEMGHASDPYRERIGLDGWSSFES